MTKHERTRWIGRRSKRGVHDNPVGVTMPGRSCSCRLVTGRSRERVRGCQGDDRLFRDGKSASPTKRRSPICGGVLEKNGVAFIPVDGGGAGVRLRERKNSCSRLRHAPAAVNLLSRAASSSATLPQVGGLINGLEIASETEVAGVAVPDETAAPHHLSHSVFTRGARPDRHTDPHRLRVAPRVLDHLGGLCAALRSPTSSTDSSALFQRARRHATKRSRPSSKVTLGA